MSVRKGAVWASAPGPQAADRSLRQNPEGVGTALPASEPAPHSWLLLGTRIHPCWPQPLLTSLATLFISKVISEAVTSPCFPLLGTGVLG